MNNILTYVKKYWIHIVAVAAVVCVCSLYQSNRSLRADADVYRQNITALTDSLRISTTRSGDLLARIAYFETKTSDLEKYSRDLAAQVEDYKKSTGKDVVSAITSETVTVLPEHEVVYVRDSTYMYKEFDFSDEWRTLTGSLTVTPDSAGVTLGPETVHARFTAGLDEAGNVFLKTDNPYVYISSLEGFTVPRTRQKRWGLGITVGGGLMLPSGKIGPCVSVGLTYNIISF